MSLFNIYDIDDKDDDKSGSPPTVTRISGHVLVANNMSGAAIFELVRIGTGKVLGEVTQLNGDLATIQMMEHTNGLAIGDLVQRMHHQMSVELGPGLLTNVFDGLQRSLISSEFDRCKQIYVKRGTSDHAINREDLYEYKPSDGLKIGDTVNEGDIFGKVMEHNFEHRLMVPPKRSGVIVTILPAGEYNVDTVLLTIEQPDGKPLDLTMIQRWPVRTPRPSRDVIPPDQPFNTGIRVLDAFFPLAKGGSCILYGPEHSGKSGPAYSVGKYGGGTDVLITVSSGERATDAWEHIMEQDYISEYKKSCLIISPANMPGLEQTIFCGATIAEYFRDMGLQVTLVVEGIDRWTRSICDLSGRLGEAPGDNGYPAYLGTKMASFYKRAGNIDCLGRGGRNGSVTIVTTAVDDEVDPSVSKSLDHTQVSWETCMPLYRRRHHPPINYLNSTSKFHQALAPHFESWGHDYMDLINEAKAILSREYDLIDTVSKIGLDHLPEEDQLTVFVAKAIKDDFLQQNIFTSYDKYCPHYKSYWILRNNIELRNQARIILGIPKNISNRVIKWSSIKSEIGETLYQISTMKFADPADGEATIIANYRELYERIRNDFRRMYSEYVNM
ncbi:hypothetical protein SAMD00019534_112430 [Acytostelium subglobosum LB1]|uniref:hypothetical protein n=1 Tax=Acytostelium subglobosum LB1 TaxID=1410327 RepID=UPI0006449211|nr:hypothetical protein SAMD00019534_112430 [Acytostelium subglobosum LB1]GAM28067.1 hypothetical protein SAMD00019534_112430 [Acytostelium subglobosum LB1]|eukprot:XP_012749026.1 hypothetical protein SAMD00019534_112430 [Acytostelium subglobosum LB1]